MKRYFLSMLIIPVLLSACKKEHVLVIDYVMEAQVIVKNDLSEEVDLTAYYTDRQTPDKATLKLSAGEDYKYWISLLSGNYEKGKINIYHCDSLDIQFSGAKNLRLYSGKYGEGDNNLENLWVMNPNPAHAGDDITMTLTINESLAALAR
ncbi:MAG: hypothetical protein IKZ51_01510 [Bacteroidales bacterium]|nr:hypothetical protein [Bacteroidales bacterium]